MESGIITSNGWLFTKNLHFLNLKFVYDTMEQIEAAAHVQKLFENFSSKIELMLTSLCNKDDMAKLKLDMESLLENHVNNIRAELDIRDQVIANLDERISKLESSVVTLVQSRDNASRERHDLANRSDDIENHFNAEITNIHIANNLELESNQSVGSNDENDAESQRNEIEREKVDLLIIGDSIVRHLNPELINPGKINKLLCLPGAQTSEVKRSLIEYSRKFDIDEIVIHTGCNSIPSNSPMDVADEIAFLLRDIESNLPNVRCHVSAILPKISKAWLPGINEINELLYDVCDVLNYNLIQHNMFANSGHINDELFARDTVHLSRRGVAQLGMDIKRSIRRPHP